MDPEAIFLLVNVLENENTAPDYNVSLADLPAYLFFKNGAKVVELYGTSYWTSTDSI
jgi:hypothetical protein